MDDNGVTAERVEQLASQVFRTRLDLPGFALWKPAGVSSPGAFREVLAGLAEALAEYHLTRFGGRLELYWLGRFSQQRTTEAHLDGAPDDSILMLGYEPSTIDSQLFLYDYTRAASDRKLEPKAFLDLYNPTFGEGRAVLDQYKMPVHGFDPSAYNVLLINNSSGPLNRAAFGMLGVLHQSVVPKSDESATRYINTLMMRVADPAADMAGCGCDRVQHFVKSGEYQVCS